MSYGNVTHEGLGKSWNNMIEWRTGSLIPKICQQDCGEYPAKCGGGCRIESLNANGSMGGNDPYCLQTKPVARRRGIKQIFI